MSCQNCCKNCMHFEPIPKPQAEIELPDAFGVCRRMQPAPDAKPAEMKSMLLVSLSGIKPDVAANLTDKMVLLVGREFGCRWHQEKRLDVHSVIIPAMAGKK